MLTAQLIRTRGFTLVELVVAMSLTAILVAFVAMFIVVPVSSYQAQVRRAELVDSADALLRLIGRDVRAALPNSVRVTTNGSAVSLEFLSIVDGVRYRDSGSTSDPSQELDFSSPDTTFSTLSQFDGLPTRPYTLPTQHYLAIYNVGVPGADAYQMANVITPVGTTITIDVNKNLANVVIPGEDKVTINNAFKFAYGSPGHRVFLVKGPVTYLCDVATNTIRRYSGYAIDYNQANHDTAAEFVTLGAANSLISNRITACQFDYAPGTAQRAGLVTLRVSLTGTNPSGSNDTVSIVHQVHVENVP